MAIFPLWFRLAVDACSSDLSVRLLQVDNTILTNHKIAETVNELFRTSFSPIPSIPVYLTRNVRIHPTVGNCCKHHSFGLFCLPAYSRVLMLFALKSNDKGAFRSQPVGVLHPFQKFRAISLILRVTTFGPIGGGILVTWYPIGSRSPRTWHIRTGRCVRWGDRVQHSFLDARTVRMKCVCVCVCVYQQMTHEHRRNLYSFVGMVHTWTKLSIKSIPWNFTEGMNFEFWVAVIWKLTWC